MAAHKYDPGESQNTRGKSGFDAEYVSRRARNNEAVKKSREKARQRARKVRESVNKLKVENERLAERIKLLSLELTFFKDVFLARAGKPQTTRPLCSVVLSVFNIELLLHLSGANSR